MSAEDHPLVARLLAAHADRLATQHDAQLRERTQTVTLELWADACTRLAEALGYSEPADRVEAYQLGHPLLDPRVTFDVLCDEVLRLRGITPPDRPPIG